jgi:hypothetical protein
MPSPRRRRFAGIASALATVATIALPWVSPASAQGGQALVVMIPEGFGLAFKHDAPDGSMKMTEYVPAGQTVETWRRMITVQHFPTLAAADPRELASRWSQSLVATCPSAKVSPQSQSVVNGHLAARVYVYMTECGGRPPESVLALVIKGQDAMHMIQHAWRPVPPTPEELRVAMDDLDRVRLCAAADAACAK